MTLCVFIPAEEGFWICRRCGRSSIAATASPPLRRCKLGVVDSQPCPMNAIVARLTPHGVDRLQRCREAKCKLMLPVEWSMRCTGMGGGKCTWVAKWADRLNGEWVCPHWKALPNNPLPLDTAAGR